MNYFYFDSCALVKLFVKSEIGHQKATEIFNNSDNKIIICELAHLEILSALRRKLTDATPISTEDFQQARALFAAEVVEKVSTGKVIFLNVDSSVFTNATDLIIKHKLKSLDAIHLQTILPYVSLNPTFVTSDNKLAEAASSYMTICNLND